MKSTHRSVLILIACSILGKSYLVAEGPIRGESFVATQRAVVNFSDLVRLAKEAPLTFEGPKEVHEHMPVPHDLPVPDDAIGTRQESAADIPDVGPPPVGSSPLPSSSFLALGDSNTNIPPDTYGAVGPNHLMVTLNSQVRIQNRAGGTISTVTMDSFWSSLGNPNAFDPRVLYDPYGNRWMFTAVADGGSATSSLLIGVSQTNDPTGIWNLYRVDVDAGNLLWADFPSMGFNKDWIVVQVNMFQIAPPGSFTRSNVYVFTKSDLYAGGSGAFRLFLLDGMLFGGVQSPALTFDNSLATLYFLQDWNGNAGGLGVLRLYTIAGVVGTEVLTPGVFITTPNPWAFGPAGGVDFAPQLGSAQKIQNNDSDMHRVIYRNGTLWAVQTVFLPAGPTPTRAAIQWWQIDIAGNTLQRARIDDPTGNVFYAFPSIAVNKNSDVLIGYSRFSASQYASANYSFRAGTDSANTLRPDIVLKAGEARYFKTFAGTKNRWGDYSSTVVDPVNDTDMWTIQEYAATPSGGFDRWGTWWGRISLTPPAPTGPNTFFTVSPCRVADTRNPNGLFGGPALAANTDRTFPIAGQCAIPSSAKAASINITVTQATSAGNLRIYPGGTSLPLVSVINYRAGQTRANNAVIVLGAAGDMAVRCDQVVGTVHFIVDVNGYFQ